MNMFAGFLPVLFLCQLPTASRAGGFSGNAAPIGVRSRLKAMPWPSNFEYILSSVDISILNVATERTDMRTDAQRLVDNLPTPIAFLRGVAGVHSDYLMSSTLSLGSEDVEECTPGGVHDAFCEMMIFDHAIDVEVRLCGALGGFSTPFRPLLPTSNRALLASQRSLALAVVAWVLDGVPFAIGQEGFQPNVNANIRMFARAWGMLLVWFRLTDKQCIPMPISTQDQVGRLGHSFNRTVQLDFDGATHLLGDRKMLAIGSKREIGLVLSQLYGMPPIRCLEPWEAYISNTRLTGSKKPFESSTQPIREHLYGRSRNMFPMTCELFVQVVFRRECAILLVLCLECREHFVVDVTRLDQALHEQVTLLLSRIDSVLECFHVLHFPRSQLNCQVVGVITQPLLPRTRNAAYIKRDVLDKSALYATGFYAAV